MWGEAIHICRDVILICKGSIILTILLVCIFKVSCMNIPINLKWENSVIDTIFNGHQASSQVRVDTTVSHWLLWVGLKFTSTLNHLLVSD